MTLIRHQDYLVDPDDISHVHIDDLGEHSCRVEIYYKSKPTNDMGSVREFNSKEELEAFLAMLIPKNKFEWEDTIYLRDKISKVIKIDLVGWQDTKTPGLELYYSDGESDCLDFDTEAERDEFLEKL
jgi:hypothetical protein